MSQTIEAPVRRREPAREERIEPDRPWIVIVWNDPVNLMTYVTYVFRRLRVDYIKQFRRVLAEHSSNVEAVLPHLHLHIEEAEERLLKVECRAQELQRRSRECAEACAAPLPLPAHEFPFLVLRAALNQRYREGRACVATS